MAMFEGDSKAIYQPMSQPTISRLLRKHMVRKPAQPGRAISFQRQKGLCYYCGEPTIYADWTMDHKTPRSRGGTGGMNKVGCCANCNRKKGNMTFAEFLETDFLNPERRAALGALRPPSIKYGAAKHMHEQRCRAMAQLFQTPHENDHPRQPAPYPGQPEGSAPAGLHGQNLQIQPLHQPGHDPGAVSAGLPTGEAALLRSGGLD